MFSQHWNLTLLVLASQPSHLTYGESAADFYIKHL